MRTYMLGSMPYVERWSGFCRASVVVVGALAAWATVIGLVMEANRLHLLQPVAYAALAAAAAIIIAEAAPAVLDRIETVLDRLAHWARLTGR